MSVKLKFFMVSTLLFGWIIGISFGMKSITMNVPSSSYCGAGTTEADGVVLQSISGTQYVNSVCTIKLKTAQDQFATKRFMINFEQFSIKNCGITIKLYYSPDSTGTPAVVLTCNSEFPGALQSTANFLSFRMEVKTLQGNDYNFRIVVTAFKDIFAGYCTELACAGKCISNDLRCDDINHCFDQSDEQGCAGYFQTNPYAIGYEATVGIVAGCVAFIVLLVIIAVIVAKVVIERRKQKDIRRRVITSPGDVSVVSSHVQQQQYKYGIPHTARPLVQPAYVPMQTVSPYAASNVYAAPPNQASYDSPPGSEAAYNNSGSQKSRLV